MDNISELERLISIRIMQEDTEAIFSLLSTERDSIFAMEIIPYYALFVQSCQEYEPYVFNSEYRKAYLHYALSAINALPSIYAEKEEDA